MLFVLTPFIKNIELAPQVVNAAYLVLSLAGNNSCKENFELMQKQWQSNMERLLKLVDESVDCELFIRACEKSIIKETFRTQTAVQENSNSAIVLNALNIARRSNRIIQVATQEAENSEDNAYVNQILVSNEFLKLGLSPFFLVNMLCYLLMFFCVDLALPTMIHSAKTLANQPSDKNNYLAWANSNEKLIDAIAKMREAVTITQLNEDSSVGVPPSVSSTYITSTDASNLPDIEALRINEGSEPFFFQFKSEMFKTFFKIIYLNLERILVKFPPKYYSNARKISLGSKICLKSITNSKLTSISNLSFAKIAYFLI